MKISEKKVILLKSWFSNLDQIVQSDLVNHELIIILVLLTLRTSICEKSMELLKPSWFSNPDQIVQSDLVNHELIIILVLLTLRTSICEKSMKLLEPQLDHTVLRIMASQWFAQFQFFFKTIFWPENRSQPIKNLNIKNKIK